jgi:HSP20 family protein
MSYRSGWQSVDALRNDFDRLVDELWGRRGSASRGFEYTEGQPQPVPVNVFETENEVMVVAAMPGIEADNVEITVENDTLTIRGEKRGPGQENHRYLRREWSYGPYERSVQLPIQVDLEKANASYGNGIVTIALPKAASRRARRIDIQLNQKGTERGERVGHRGTEEAGPGRVTGPKGNAA